MNVEKIIFDHPYRMATLMALLILCTILAARSVPPEANPVQEVRSAP